MAKNRDRANYLVLSSHKLGNLYKASTITEEHANELAKHFSVLHNSREFIYKLVSIVEPPSNNRVHADAGDSAVSTSSLQASADTISQTVTKRTQRG